MARKPKVDVIQLAELIATNAYLAWNLALVNVPLNQAVADILRDIKVGDMVLEVTSMIRKEPAIHRLGKLLDVKTYEGGGVEYTIKLLTGELYIWSNCRFIKVCETLPDIV